MIEENPSEILARIGEKENLATQCSRYFAVVVPYTKSVLLSI